jgi:hypothetical protein
MKTLNHPSLLISIFSLALSATSALAASDGPVKVYILAGQSNMVGIGQVNSGSTRWGAEFSDAVVSVYKGPYDPKTDYDALKPEQTLKLTSFGGGEPTPYPPGEVRIARGFYQAKETGTYEFNPGYGDSTFNIMVVNGIEAHRKEIGGESLHKPVKLEAGKKVPFKITYLTAGANGLGWTSRLDVPGTLHTVVHEEKKYPYLIDKEGRWKSRDDV